MAFTRKDGIDNLSSISSYHRLANKPQRNLSKITIRSLLCVASGVEDMSSASVLVGPRAEGKPRVYAACNRAATHPLTHHAHHIIGQDPSPSSTRPGKSFPASGTSSRPIRTDHRDDVRDPPTPTPTPTPFRSNAPAYD